MAQKPLNEMSHKPGKMSEESEYVLHEVKNSINSISKKMDNVVYIKDMKPVLKKIESLVEPKDIIESLNNLSNKIDSLKEAMKTLTQKLDNEDVTNLDSDYESSVLNLLS